MLGTVNIIPTPSRAAVWRPTPRACTPTTASPTARHDDDDRGFGFGRHEDSGNPIPSQPGQASSQIKHVVFINKENATHDLLLGDITQTRRGVPVNGEPAFSLGYEASPNHHELALRFAFSDNFFLEPSVSSDGHRWLTGQYTTESEETHWPASYGGKRNDSGDDPEVIKNYPGRIGFTDANASPEPNDYNEHGGIFLHLDRHGKSFINFGNGFEFAVIDEPAWRRADRRARARQRADGEGGPRQQRSSVPDLQHAHPRRPAARGSDAVQPIRPLQAGLRVPVRRPPAATSAGCRSTSISTIRTTMAAAPATSIPAGPDWSFTRFVQDNDAALGLTVELLSNSPCWKDTVIFVVEDDTQNGADHVDGHRSILLAISPWVKKQYVSKTHTSLASIFKTVNLILGMPPLNQYDAAATDLRDMFTSRRTSAPTTLSRSCLRSGSIRCGWR